MCTSNEWKWLASLYAASVCYRSQILKLVIDFKQGCGILTNICVHGNPQSILFSFFCLDLPPGYTYPAITMGYKGGPSPQEVQLAEHADLEAEQAEPAEPAPQPLPLSPKGEEPACQPGVGSPTRTSQEVEKEETVGVIQAEEQVEEGESGVTCGPATVSQTSIFPDSPSNPHPDTATMLPNTQTSEMEIPVPAKDWKEKNVELQDKVQVSQPVGSRENDPEKAADDECGLTCDPGTGHPSPTMSSCPMPSTLGNQYPGSCIWSLELLIAAALCATRDARMVPPVSVSDNAVAPNYGIELLSEMAELERTQQQRNDMGDNEGENKQKVYFQN